jgi:hypothetical protein
MDAESIVYLVNFNSQAMGLNLEGLTQEDSLVQPPSGNCINWMLGHLLVHRYRMLETLGEPAAIPEALMRYDRGSQPITGDGPDVLPLERLRDELASSKEKVVAAIQNAGDEGLTKPAGKGTVGQRLLMLNMHEAYHTGQVGVLRRIAGKERGIG